MTEYINPKIEDFEKDVQSFRNDIGDKSTQTQRRELEKMTDMLGELMDFRDEIINISNLPYKPNLDDGVLISAAPLWSLFRHRQWHQELKKTWKALEKGDFDWAHLAFNIWPQRVIKKCQKDLSLAIAHGLETLLWDKIKDGTGRDGKLKFKWVPKKLSDEDLQNIINEKTGK